MIHASDIMSGDVIVIYEDMMISQAAHLMLRDRVSAFPVVNHQMGVVGIITITDLFKMINKFTADSDVDGFYRSLPQLKEQNVSDVMSKDVVIISPETSLHQMIEYVVDKNIHTFPVMENGKLVGIIGRHDILNAIFMFEVV